MSKTTMAGEYEVFVEVTDRDEGERPREGIVTWESCDASSFGCAPFEIERERDYAHTVTVWEFPVPTPVLDHLHEVCR